MSLMSTSYKRRYGNVDNPICHLFPNGFLKCIALLVVPIVVCLGCTGSDNAPLPPESPAKESTTATSKFFEPKTALEDLRFVYHWETGLFMDLEDEHAALLDEFMKEFIDVSADTHTPFLKGHSVLSEQQQQFLANRIPEKVDDRYCVLFLERNETTVLQITEFALKPTGDGGFRGFLAKLQPAKGRILPTTERRESNWRRALSLAFRSDVPSQMSGAMSEKVSDEEILRQVGRVLEDTDQLRNPEIYACRQFYLEYPKVVAYLAEFRGSIVRSYSDSGGEHSKTYRPSFLVCLVPDENGLRILPFPAPSESFGGLMIEVGDYPANDLSPSDTFVYILPDLDGDSSCELLVDTTVMQLFRFAKTESESADSRDWSIELVKKAYFGP